MRPTLPALTSVRVHGLIRFVLLALSVGVALGTSTTDVVPFAVALAVLAITASRPGDHLWVLASTSAEALMVGLAVIGTGWEDSPFLPYVIAPAFTGALAAGVLGGLLPVGVTAALLVLAPVVDPGASIGDNLSSGLAQWIVLALLVAAVATWVRSVLVEAERSQPDVRAAQLEAFRLLTELRSVARQLPGTLDAATTAESMLERAREVAPVDAGVVLVAAPDSRQLNVVARIGPERPHWGLSLDDGSALADAWEGRAARAFDMRLSQTDGPARGGSALVAPLLSGSRSFGMLVIEAETDHAYSRDTIAAVTDRVSDLALQLQTGLVFDEVRELATAEERRRLSREIHDGIAQELASVAYALDTAASDLEPEHIASAQVRLIRDEVRRLLTELRMSLFDLRSEVAADEGLGAAIGRHVRAVGAATGLTVHLSLNEGPHRLAAETEAELLRIVQEAVANARRHSQARNLWVSCTVDPPMVQLSVEDDGRGLGRGGSIDSHGLAIMRERASRVRGDLRVEPRSPRGTRVRLTIGRVRT